MNCVNFNVSTPKVNYVRLSDESTDKPTNGVSFKAKLNPEVKSEIMSILSNVNYKKSNKGIIKSIIELTKLKKDLSNVCKKLKEISGTEEMKNFKQYIETLSTPEEKKEAIIKKLTELVYNNSEKIPSIVEKEEAERVLEEILHNPKIMSYLLKDSDKKTVQKFINLFGFNTNEIVIPNNTNRNLDIINATNKQYFSMLNKNRPLAEQKEIAIRDSVGLFFKNFGNLFKNIGKKNKKVSRNQKVADFKSDAANYFDYKKRGRNLEADIYKERMRRYLEE